MHKILTQFLIVMLTVSCGTKEKKAINQSKPKSLNISVLIDLSDRITVNDNPNQMTRDTTIIGYLVDGIHRNIRKNGAFSAIDHFQLFISPTPSDERISTLLSESKMDLGAPKANKREILLTSRAKIQESVDRLYSSAIQDRRFIGSDIWRFIKNDVIDYSIRDTSLYANILVILTDGYIYHKDTVFREGNKSSYITGPFLRSSNLQSSNWREIYEKGGFGLIQATKDLSMLNVLVLEVRAENNNVFHEDVIKRYITDWFQQMNVANIDVYNTDMPINTKARIDNYLNRHLAD